MSLLDQNIRVSEKRNIGRCHADNSSLARRFCVRSICSEGNYLIPQVVIRKLAVSLFNNNQFRSDIHHNIFTGKFRVCHTLVVGTLGRQEEEESAAK
jgi:hypothetical protein